MRRLLLAALLGGCALTSKSPALEVRYFTPERVEAHAAQIAAEPEPKVARVRLGRITSSANLRTRIVYRKAPFELAEYEDRRWTDSPEVYLRRSLVTALFDDGRIAQAVGGQPPTLDAELVAFEEVDRDGGARAGRVEIAYVLHDERDVIASGRVAVERPARSGEMGDVVEAIGAALDAAVAQIATGVAKRLAR